MSSRPRSTLLRLGLAAGLAGTLIFAAQPAEAQGPPSGRPPTVRPPHGHDRSNIPPRPRPRPPHGHDRSNIPPRANPDPPGKGDPHGPSDPKGPGDLASPGSRGAGNGNGKGKAAHALSTGTLAHATAGLLPSQAQQTVLGLVEGTQPGAGAAVSAALAPSANRGAGKQAARLSADMQGLFGRPDGLHDAMRSYNALVDASSEEFLRNPSPEFLTVQTVLALLVEESLVETPSGS